MPLRHFLLSLSACAVAWMAAGGAMAQTDEGGAEICDADAVEWSGPAYSNAISLHSLVWTPFGTEEWGWETYVPLMQKELNTNCSPDSPKFARKLAEFQAAHALPPTGWFDQITFQTFRGMWQERRPFIMGRVRQEPCPEPPPLYQLGYLVESEEHADRLTRLLRRDVLDAYRAMVAAARAEVPEVAANPELLQIFSGFRDPAADAARCAQQNNCDGLRRATCSAHRTGTAVDLYVGQVFGLGVDNTSPSSRLYMSKTPTYRWLVRNAGRFGFTPYVYEPWHWEWISPTGGYAGP
ncbi:D-alanyl-D-alanine carboxypeptidase family protein [Brevundimonas lenta]|uniref:D-alanyl-D-alanine carboxypeptidase-like core domain-containing protein n=1 Tax=Brevundimonas lenta TaxID=424796 RepID=A0A7W6JDB8_9CAUL|nr:D-alanyl-D-alanine carboxypeptidase family protein [Brevundimonas lenta]MBB4082946.1 hypothetical protein [Brevundimonas lenta]